MHLPSWLTRRHDRRATPQRPACRLGVECLEGRVLPANFTAANVAELIAGITASNLTPEADTITLAVGRTFKLTAVNNTASGATGLPVVAAGNDLTILGNGSTIERAKTGATPSFRLFDVAAGASLTLTNMTLQGGTVFGYEGGGIYSQGSVTLQGCTVRNNAGAAIHSGGALVLRDSTIQDNSGTGILSTGSATLQGCTVQNNAGGITSVGTLAVLNSTIQFNTAVGTTGGGGIFSSGALTVQSSTIQFNTALGTVGGVGEPGGNAFGGGVYIAGGTASLTDVILNSNTAQGGAGGSAGRIPLDPLGGTFDVPGGNGGNGAGGGLYVAAGTVTLHGVVAQHNVAAGGKGGKARLGLAGGADGVGHGGGFYFAPAASVCLDIATLASLLDNTPDDLVGLYTLC